LREKKKVVIIKTPKKLCPCQNILSKLHPTSYGGKKKKKEKSVKEDVNP